MYCSEKSFFPRVGTSFVPLLLQKQQKYQEDLIVLFFWGSISLIS